MKNKIFVTISFVLFAFCFAVFYLGLQKPNIYTPKLDKQIELPNFAGNDFFSGEKVISDNLLKKNSYYIINIWASWCIPCRTEHSFLMELKNKNFNLLGINYKDTISKANNYLERNGDPFMYSIFDNTGSFALKLGVTGAPETFLIIDGVIVEHRIGEVNRVIWEQDFEVFF